MPKKKIKNTAPEQPKLHKRSLHHDRYDLKQLAAISPDLAPFIQPNVRGEDSIDFANPVAVKSLNQALLHHHYGVAHWDIPEGYLCPPIPGRADYMHHMADLLCTSNFGNIPTGNGINCLDIGVGASCIYPILGNKLYGWSFIGADIDPVSIESATQIIAQNPPLDAAVTLRLQPTVKDIIYGILKKEDRVDMTICNPPFHASAEDARSGTQRKLKNLQKEKPTETTLNFGGQSNELWCEGGEVRFIREMIRQSKNFASSCYWYSTLVSKQSHLKNIYQALKEAEAMDVTTIPMGQGNKTSRIVAWTFLTKTEQKEWKFARWKTETPDNK